MSSGFTGVPFDYSVMTYVHLQPQVMPGMDVHLTLLPWDRCDEPSETVFAFEKWVA